VIFVLLFFTFEETMFPRFLFPTKLPVAKASTSPSASFKDKDDSAVTAVASPQPLYDFPKRTRPQRLRLWVYHPQDATTYWQYFRRPFFLWTFPNIVIVSAADPQRCAPLSVLQAGFIFAFGCTAGIVSFNTISEILTNPPYDWSTTSTGLVFFAALIGSLVGWATGALGDQIVITLARRNGGVKEPEMRLWTLCFSFVYAAVGYPLYGWGAQKGLHWMTIACGVGFMIAHQVSACSVATAYAMECYPGVRMHALLLDGDRLTDLYSDQLSGELVVVLALCSSMINFAISYSVQPFINRVGYGWVFVFFGLCVLASMVAAVPAMIFGKRWRSRRAKRYYAEVSGRSR
jgi:hypothetical protein